MNLEHMNFKKNMKMIITKKFKIKIKYIIS